MLHDAPWLAGPAPRRYDPDEAYYECVCGAKVTREGSYGCQGSDVCGSRACEDCKQSCDGCGLPSCSEHLHITEAEDWCDLCLESVKEEAAKVLKELKEAV